MMSNILSFAAMEHAAPSRVNTFSPVQSEQLQSPTPAKVIRPCLICLQPLYDKKQIVTQLPCSRKHAYHFACIAAWTLEEEGGNCPECRADIQEPLSNPETVLALTARLHQSDLDNRHLESRVYWKNHALETNKKEIKQLRKQKNGLYAKQTILKRRIQQLEGQLNQRTAEAQRAQQNRQPQQASIATQFNSTQQNKRQLQSYDA